MRKNEILIYAVKITHEILTLRGVSISRIQSALTWATS